MLMNFGFDIEPRRIIVIVNSRTTVRIPVIIMILLVSMVYNNAFLNFVI